MYTSYMRIYLSSPISLNVPAPSTASFCLLFIIRVLCPFAGSQIFGRCNFYAITMTLCLIKEVVYTVFIDNITIDTRLSVLRNKNGLGVPSISVKSLLA